MRCQSTATLPRPNVCTDGRHIMHIHMVDHKHAGFSLAHLNSVLLLYYMLSHYLRLKSVCLSLSASHSASLCLSLSTSISLSFSVSLSLSLPLSPCLSHSPCLSLRVIVWIRRDCIWPDSRVVGWQWNKWPDNHLLLCSLSTQGYEQKNHYRPETEPSCHVTCDTHAHISGTYSRKE